MLVGTVDAGIYQHNPYEMKTESHQTPDATDKADDASKKKSQKILGESNEPHDEYIPSGDQASKTPGIYRPETDKNGQQKIVFDKPDSPEKSEQSDTAQGKNNGGSSKVTPNQTEDNGNSPKVAPDQSKDDENSKEKHGPEKSGDKKHGLWCTVNTDKVDAEIKKLKEEKQQIEQQIKKTGDENKCKELKKQLSQIESELSAKDNDVYRKQHATYTDSAAG